MGQAGSRTTEALLDSSTTGLAPTRRGKVRDVYDLGDDRLVIVATDRISAYDAVIPNGVPDKGRVLTQISAFWFDLLSPVTPHHLLSTELSALPARFAEFPSVFDGRVTLARKTKPFPVECVVRGFLAGSAWREYRETGTIAGVPLPRAMKEGDRLDQALFTPATKAETGHDENITFEQMVEIVGREHAETLRAKSLAIFCAASAHVARTGLVLVDTKFEFGLCGDEVLLIDEVLTPDSSRFWELGEGRRVSFDKQFVRDWLDTSGWDHTPPAPPLPAEIIERTRSLYIDAYRRITGGELRGVR